MQELRKNYDSPYPQGQERTAEEGKAMTKKKRTDKQTRLARLNEIILAHPTYGRKKLAKELKKEYGIAFRLTTIAAAREATLLGEKIPHKRPTGIKSVESILAEALITPERAIIIGFDSAFHKLISAGFIKTEIQTIFSAGNVPELFGTKPFERMLSERRQWVRDRLRAGWTKREIIAEVKSWYRKRDTDTKGEFAFLRATYPEIVAKKADITKCRVAAGKKAKQQIKPLYKRKLPVRITGRAVDF